MTKFRWNRNNSEGVAEEDERADVVRRSKCRYTSKWWIRCKNIQMLKQMKDLIQKKLVKNCVDANTDTDLETDGKSDAEEKKILVTICLNSSK